MGLAEPRVRVTRGDITALEVDAIVNAANSHLTGGGGVDGAIHRAGGPEIMDETRRRFPDGCPTGRAVTTGAGRLKARWVIHAVGPVWWGGLKGEDRALASAWTSALREAIEHGAGSVAFPSLSTGAYRFPVDRAAKIAAAALGAAISTVDDDQAPEVVICAFSARDERAYRGAFAAWLQD
ncbi:MAG: O-acetyl-ADP-ribose deacetylase [Chloroflexota bacterium]|jgi:O-acetyl-ADP-ribose deacetylase (regulator of RNase III)|nr:O-acetyl-ADP-ribose deacetylase [Chloroflexota bacterium]